MMLTHHNSTAEPKVNITKTITHAPAAAAAARALMMLVFLSHDVKPTNCAHHTYETRKNESHHTCLPYECSYVWHGSLVCDTYVSHVRHDSFWHVSNEWHDSFLRISRVRHDSFSRVSHVRRDSFSRVSHEGHDSFLLFLMCDMTHAYVFLHDVFLLDSFHMSRSYIRVSHVTQMSNGVKLTPPTNCSRHTYENSLKCHRYARWSLHTATHCNTHCNTLQHTATHTATHCNTLQHTVTHCNTLQHTATHCNSLQHTSTHCNTL